ncbi:MAG: site-specific DNA-methyltransferase [Akkermansia muciniphila]|nr:site-specific DNA-methyltransferase [Akkermansia muciniphila]
MSYDRLSPESPIDTNIDRLAQVFPSVVREGKVDFDSLRQLLGDDIGEPHELYGLNWKGKAQARRAALTPSLGTLRPCPEESVDWDSTKNLYIEGDNLEVLKLLRKSYSGKVKMIYIDPPYNTGKEFVYPDDYQCGIGQYKKLTEQEDTLPSNVESNGRFHTDWLNMMYPRLSVARELLSKDGVIMISIDDNEVSNLVEICNQIYGPVNLVSIFPWQSRASIQNDTDISINHEYIVVYARNRRQCNRRLKSSNEAEWWQENSFVCAPMSVDIDKYKNPDNDPRGPWKADPFDAPNERANLTYEIQNPNTKETFLPPRGRHWRTEKKYYEELLSDGRIFFGKSGKGRPQLKVFFNEKRDYGSIDNTWFSADLAGTATDGTKELMKLFEGHSVFDTPKPTKLICKLLNLSNLKKDSLILDFFSGSATTAHAVMKLNAEDGGNRRHIMVQLPEPCKADTPAGKAGYKDICEIGKERIRRAGKKLKEEAGLMGQGLDTGFRVYKLDSSNVKPWNPDAEDLGASLDLFSEHLVEGRTPDDLLTEVMLKSGIDLCEEMETREIAGHRVYSLGYGQFYACMDRNLSGAEGELALGIAAWHAEECAAVGGEQQDTCTVFVADEAFAGRDDAKMNFVSTLQQYGICNVKAL